MRYINIDSMSLVNLIFSENTSEISVVLRQYPAVYVVADRNVFSGIVKPLVKNCIGDGVAIRGVLRIRTSERRKNFRTVERIHRWLIEKGAERNAMVLAIGGGITTDLAGFAACTYKRGVKYANVPTTLLAQVDAAIGGKTGCNIAGYKNMAGVICQPQFTFICPGLVKTLPKRIFTAGYAELLKTFIIGDAKAYREAVESAGSANLSQLIRRAASIKAKIVESDQFEKGERKVLNLGHTFAHAIEYKAAHSLLHRGISHGHAVAMGMVMAAELSEEKGIAQKGLAKRLEEDFSKVGLPVRCPWTMEQLMPVIASDKKAEGGKVNFILIEEIGKVVIKKL